MFGKKWCIGNCKPYVKRMVCEESVRDYGGLNCVRDMGDDDVCDVVLMVIL